MTQKIYAIVADKLEDTGMVSFKFMFDSKAPFEKFIDISSRYGLLTLAPRPDDFIDPFKIFSHLEMEPAVEDEDKPIMRWSLFVFKSGQGQVLGGGVDFDEKSEGLSRLIGEVDSFVLLTHFEALDGLKLACELQKIELTVFRFEGTLTTS